MASQSKVSLFLAALKTQLAVTLGATYWNTYTVVRVPGFEDRYLETAATLTTAVDFMVPETQKPEVRTFGGGLATVHTEVRVNLLLAKRYEAGDDPFNPPSPDRWEEQDRLAQDIQGAVLGDRGVGATCLNIQITDVEMGPTDSWAATWALVAVSLLATVESTVAAP